MPIRTILSLGRHLARMPESGQRVRSFCLLTSAFLVTLVSLAVSAAPAVVSAHETRLTNRTLQVAEQSAAGTTLWAVDFGPLQDRRWNGQEITAVYLSATEEDPAAAAGLGLPRLPKFGEVFISPALQKDLPRSPLIRELLVNSKVSGIIANTGLTAPQERRIIFGVERNDSWLQPLSGIGGNRITIENDFNVLYGSLIFISIIIILPAGLIAIISARLSFDRRRQRVESLRILGIGDFTIRLLLSVETLLAVLPGVSMALITYLALRGPGSHMTEHFLPVFGEDVPGGAIQLLLVPALIITFFLAWSIFGTGGKSSGTRSTQIMGKPRYLPVLLFLTSAIGYPFYLYFISANPGMAAVSFWISTAVSALLLSTSSRALITPIARALAHFSTKTGWFYGFRLAQFRPGLCQRLAGALALVTIFVAAALLFIGNFGGYREGPEIRTDQPANISLDLSTEELSEFDAKKLPGSVIQLPRFTLKTDGPDTVRAIQASCQQLAAVTVGNCTSRPTWLSTTTGSAKIDALISPNKGKTKVLRLLNGDLSAPAAAQSLSYRPSVDEGIANIFIPKSTELNLGKPDGITLLAPQQETDLLLATLTAAYPDKFVSVGNFANPRILPMQNFVAAFALALAGSLVLGSMALTLGALGDIAARRRALLGLLMLGTGRADAVRAHVASVTVPLITLGGLAVGTAAVNYQSFHKVDPDVQLPSGVHLALAVGTFSAALAVTLITLPAALKPLQPDELRSL